MAERTGSIRVLHVDDEPGFAEVVAESLEHGDDRYSVETATDAEQALEALSARRFDCVVSDYDMPGMDGLELLEAVREDHPDLPFVLFTGEGSEAVASDAIAAGVTDYLLKPRGTEGFSVLGIRIDNAIEQYRARRELESSRNRLSLFFEQSPLGVIEWDEDFRFVRLNAAAEDILGYRSGELAGESWEAIVPESDRPAVADVVDGLLEAAGGYHSVNENVTKDGERVVCEWHNRVVTDDDEVVAVFSQFRDVTEREERDQTLTLMDRIIREMNDGAVITQDGTVEYVNPQMARLVGAEEAELLGESMSTYIAPEHRELVEGRHRARLGDADEDPPEIYEIDLLTADGGRLPVEINVSRIEYDGAPATVSLVRDVTERRARDEEIRRLKEEYETVFETAQDAIFLVDVDRSDDEIGFELLRLNPAHEAISGLSSEEVRGKAPHEFLTEEDAAEVEANYRRFVETGEPIAYEEVIEMPAREIHWQTKLGPVLDDEGRTTQIVGVARDVTDRHERQRELERQNERLDEFASVVSHDLRNPLNVAQGRLGLAIEECGSDHLEPVRRAHDRMDALIGDLLELAREGSEIGELEAVHLGATAETCWETVATADARLEVEGDRTILADPGRLKQLLENLFRNAVDHGGEGVTVTVGSLDGGFYVADDGPGVPAAERDRVFDAGYSTTEAGTGFGLSIVREIATAHGWEVGLTESATGGARFEFTGVRSG